MVSAQYVLRFIEAGRAARRPPLVGMDFLHERRVAIRLPPAPQGAFTNFLVERFARSQPGIARCAVALRVFTPSGNRRSGCAAVTGQSSARQLSCQYDPRARRSSAR
jgi:hypothetical protein